MAMTPVIARVLQQAERNGDKIAFGSIGYGRLARLVCGLSARIKGERVLVACGQRPNTYVAMLAALHAGATYAPVNAEAPLARQLLIRDRFEPDVVIGDDDTPDALKAGHFLSVGEESSPRPAVDSSAPAYVMFTSGSTGVPKGVVISRRAMDHYIGWVVSALGLGPEARVSQHPNVGFDLSVMDVFGALSAGAELFPLGSFRDRLFPAAAIRSLALTHWISVPSVVDLMFRGKGVEPGALSSLERMIFCGEPLLAHHLEKLFCAAPELEVINTYGPTEATVSMTALRLNRDNWQHFHKGSISLGEQIPGMEIALAGESGQEGEIVISGPQVADGYWRDPERTARAFNGQTFRTGDWAAWVDGALYFRERIDRQVKWHGNRIELGEIETAIQAATGNRAIALLRPEGLVGVVEGGPVDVAKLQQMLQQTLPDYMIPARIVSVGLLPRNVNDKIDHRALADILEQDLSAHDKG